ncbi:MAG: uroporphyrinogen-III C-methyltransferase [Chloroflexi bacterium]|nr:uroporphyrinogen-III C-methyltransferase [Chloroflexota bacterium]
MPRTQPAQRGVAYFAAFLDLLGKKVVVVGGGRVASSKVRALLPCQPAPLVVVAPKATQAIRRAANDGQLNWLQREYAAGDLAGASLAFGASDDRDLNARVAADARALGIPVLAVDDVPNCDFIAPALVRRGDLTIAISTSGRSPAMARRAREHLERALPPFWGDLLDVAAAARERLGATRSVVEPDAWQTGLGEVEDLVRRGEVREATEVLARKLEHSLFEPEPVQASQSGLVSLVGAGPGDPDLLTLRAVERLRAADVVVHDRLVSERVLEYAAPDAERIDVGKQPGGGGSTQSEINALLVDLGRQGRRVVRLKGGDPFVFGRGGEEVLALSRAGIAFEVVPGVSSALAAPAAAGIPVTHRGLSASVTVVNGHDADQHDWDALARSAGTLVFLMAVERLEQIAARLLNSGRRSDEPAALIEWATTARQRIVLAPLGELVATARAEGVEPPAVLVVGPTAAFASELSNSERVRIAEVARA